MSNNRFKNLVFDNKSNDEKKEPPKLKENSRWKIEGGDTNRFKTSNNRGGNRGNYRGNNREDNREGNREDNREGNRGNYRGGGNRGNYRGGNRNNFNRRYKGNYRKPSGPAPCAADRFGINFKNLEKFDTKNEKMIHKKKEVVEKPKFVKMKKDEEEYVPTEEEMKITLAMAQKYQYITESEDEGEDEQDDDAVSVDSMEDWKPQHL
jgi:hypothetical protein